MAEEYKTEAHQLPAGTVLHGRFEVKRVIGEGGFGITYEGLDRVLNARVAIKEYYMTGFVNRNTAVSLDVIPSVGEKAETFRKNREKFYSEAMVLAKFGEEDGIVRIQDYFQENETAYIVMEYLDGGSLKDRLNRDGKMNWEEALDLLMPGMVSLEHVHEAGIIHRDISPDNIMLTKSGRIRILDFGAARKATDGDPKSLSVILKPGYAPEEQYRSKGVQGPWTDVYAFCATLYRCITGQVPDEAMDRLVSDTLRPIHFLVPECPVSVSKVIGKGMAVSQKDRYQSLQELIADLEWARRNPGASELPEGRKEEEPLVPAEILGEPFLDMEQILIEENTKNLVPDLQAMFDESLPLQQVSLPGLTTERRSGTYRKSVTGQQSAVISRPVSSAPAADMDPNATVYAGKVETYTSPREGADSVEAAGAAQQEAADSQGATGAQGAAGSQLAAGAQGAVGSQLAAGAQEASSSPGASDPQGADGPEAAAGQQGAAGLEGTAGSPVAGASQADAGAQESAGSEGTPGAQEIPAIQTDTENGAPIPLQFTSQPDSEAAPDRSLAGAGGDESSAAAGGADKPAVAGAAENPVGGAEKPAGAAPEPAKENKPGEKKTGLFSALKSLFS